MTTSTNESITRKHIQIEKELMQTVLKTSGILQKDDRLNLMEYQEKLS